MENGLLYRVAVWRGWVCSPSLHVFGGKCTYHARRPSGYGETVCGNREEVK
jgi:hypothetical protein